MWTKPIFRGGHFRMGNRTSDICRICSASEKGLVRKNNEDAVLTLADDGVFAVMDGMGGGDAGEIASGIVKGITREEARGLIDEIYDNLE